MSTEVRTEQGVGRYDTKNGIKRVKERRIKLVLGIIVLILITIAVLFINSALLSRSGSTAKVIPYGQIVLPDWITEDLIPVNEYSRPGTALDDITGFVVHYTGNPGTTAEQNRSYFAGLAQTGQNYASSNFIIDSDGGVILCVPMDEMAYASNSRNNDTLSIEVCHPDETGKFTGEAYNSLIRLLAWLCDTYDISPETIIRHGDITEKACPLYYMENQDKWEALLEDVKEAGSQISYK